MLVRAVFAAALPFVLAAAPSAQGLLEVYDESGVHQTTPGTLDIPITASSVPCVTAPLQLCLTDSSASVFELGLAAMTLAPPLGTPLPFGTTTTSLDYVNDPLFWPSLIGFGITPFAGPVWTSAPVPLPANPNWAGLTLSIQAFRLEPVAALMDNSNVFSLTTEFCP